MRRLLALLAAVAMVVIALVLRDRIGSDDHAEADGAARLTCATELAPVCAALADGRDDVVVEVEEALVTGDRVAASPADGDDLGLDAWLTLAPVAAMSAEARQRALLPPVLGEPTAPLATSPLVVVAWEDRAEILAEACGGEVSWRCVGERAGQPWDALGGPASWGPVAPAHPDADVSATGLLTLAHATASWFERTGYASNDFSEPGFGAWFDQLERSITSFPTPPRTPLDEMLSMGPSTFDLTGSVESVATSAIEGSRVEEDLRVLYPSPMAVAEVVLAPTEGSSAGARLRDLLGSPAGAEALAAAGWQVAEPGTSPVDPGLPRPGVLEALRERWRESVR
jgi:hypothetical protein